MQGVVYSAPMTLENLDVVEPEPQPSDVIVEIRAAGIYGSELESFASASTFRVPPLIMGHEIAGVRANTGAHVAINPLVACMACDLCGWGSMWVGLHGSDAELDVRALIRNEMRVLTTFGYSRQDFPVAVDFAGRLGPIGSRLIPLEQGAEAFLSLLLGPVSATKVVLIN